MTLFDFQRPQKAVHSGELCRPQADRTTLSTMQEPDGDSAKADGSSRLAALCTNNELCDATIIVNDQSFPIHVAIVAEISSVFKKALCGDFKEAGKSD